MYRPKIRRSSSLIAVALAVVGLMSVGCFGGDDSGGGDDFTVIVQTPPVTEAPTVTPSPTPTPTPSPSPTPVPVCGQNPDPAPANLLQIVDPKPNTEVKEPIEVQGWGSTIGKDDAGVALAIVDFRSQTLQVLDLPPQPRAFRVAPPGLDITDDTRPFGADVVIGPVVEPTRYCLWAYLETDAEGHARKVVQVPITVVP
jgi:hypothetical protein